jgi:hypothetical protein
MPTLGQKDTHGICTFSIHNAVIPSNNPYTFQAYRDNYFDSRRPSFVDQMTKLLKRKRMIIVHKYGRIYRDDYFKKWIKIAEKSPFLLIWCRYFDDGMKLCHNFPHPENLMTIYEGTNAVTALGFDNWINDPNGVECPQLDCQHCMLCMRKIHVKNAKPSWG